MANVPHPWLVPLHRRVLALGLAVAWLGFEGWIEPGGLWFWLAAGIFVYGVWDFFLSGIYAPAATPPAEPPADGGDRP
ncbi:MAG: hypothetical protein WAS21_26240 [Geminicoccaceae bacterium]